MSDIQRWLGGLGLGQYTDAFSANDIDADILARLTEADLKELGVASLGHRKKLLEAIAGLTADGSLGVLRPTDARTTDTLVPPTSTRAATSEAERRQLTVMFCDLVGSTELSHRLDPEDLGEVVAACQSAWQGAIERYEGYIARYMGDGLLAYFGYPQAHEDDAERAVRAGLAVVEATRSLPPGAASRQGLAPAVRVGIETGPVVVGELIGEGAARESAVMGETPNLAARLQGLAEPDSVVVGAGTHDLASGRFEFRDLGRREVKGAAESVPMWRVIGETAVESRFDVARGRGLTPLVGREDEVDLLGRRWQRAKGGEGQVVLLSGEAGIGKSRLVETLREAIVREEHWDLGCQCSAYHTGSPLYPVARELERTMGAEAGDDVESRRRKLVEALGCSGQDDEESVGVLAEMLSIGGPGEGSVGGMTPEERRAKTIGVLCDRVAGLARTRPVLLVLEDVQWIDPTSLDLLDVIVGRVADLRALVVLTFRSEWSPPWIGESHVTFVALSRLSPAQGAAMVERLSTVSLLSGSVKDEIVHRSDGLPLFVEELTRSVLESAELPTAGSVQASPVKAVPRTLHDSLMARLDRLGEAKEIAQVAAVIGREFPYRLVAGVTEKEEERLRVALEELERSGLVLRHGRPPEAVYVFKHALVQDAAYGSLLRRTRQRLHARVANLLERDYPNQAEVELERLARHYTEAGMPDRAVEHWSRALDRALESAAPREAASHATNGLAQLGLLPESLERDRVELELQTALGGAKMWAEGWSTPEAGRAYDAAHRLSRKLGDVPRLLESLQGLNEFCVGRGLYREALPYAEESIATAEAVNDEPNLMVGYQGRGNVRLWMGELEAGRRDMERAVELGERITCLPDGPFWRLTDMLAIALGELTWALELLGFAESERRTGERALERAREVKKPFTLAATLWMRIYRDLMTNPWRVPVALLEELQRLATEHGLHYSADASRWEAYRRLLNREASPDEYRRIREQEKGSDFSNYACSYGCYEIAIHSVTGDAEAGLNAIEECLDHVHVHEERWCEAELHRQKGELLLARSRADVEAAEREFRTAIGIAQSQQAKLWEVKAATSLARLLQRRNQRVEAREVLAPVYAWFTEGFDTPHLLEAKALLDELGS